MGADGLASRIRRIFWYSIAAAAAPQDPTAATRPGGGLQRRLELRQTVDTVKRGSASSAAYSSSVISSSG